jgi:DNA-binding MarR family transcriptional regulator
MSQILRDHIKQTVPFEDRAQEAMLNLFVAAAHVRRRVEQACQEYDLHFSHHNVLRILRGVHPDGHPRSEILDRMLDPSPDVTRLIDKLVDRELVRRSKSPEDRRVTIHTITDEGLALLEELDPEVRAVQRWFDDRVSDRDLQQLSRICEGIYAEYGSDGRDSY